MSCDVFLQSTFQFGFLPSKPCLFPLKSSLEFVLHRGKPKFISLPVKFPADRSKFQFCTAVFVCFVFLNPAAEIVLKMLFNTLLKITPHNMQKEEEMKEKCRDLHDDHSRWVTHPVPNPARQGLT